MPRAQTGVGLATLTLTAAVLTSSCRLLPAAFVGLTVLILVATVAHRVPVLHRAPWVGSREAAVKVLLDGREDLRIGIRRHPHEPLPPELLGRGPFTPPFEPRTAHLQLGIASRGRGPLRDAAVTVMHPEGVGHVRVDASGREVRQGGWMPPASESLMDDEDGEPVWSDYWVWQGELPDGSVLMWFNLTFAQAGDYPIRVKITAPDLYRDVVSDHVLHVVEVPRDQEPPVDRLAYAIQNAEALKVEVERMDQVIDTSRVMTAITAILMALDGRQDLTDLAIRTKAVHTGPQAGREYQAALIEAKVRAAYDARRRLGG